MLRRRKKQTKRPQKLGPYLPPDRGIRKRTNQVAELDASKRVASRIGGLVKKYYVWLGGHELADFMVGVGLDVLPEALRKYPKVRDRTECRTVDDFICLLAKRRLQNVLRFEKAERRGGKATHLRLEDRISADAPKRVSALLSDAGTVSVRNEVRTAIAQSLPVLTKNEKEVIRRRFFLKETRAEIAKALGYKSPSAITKLEQKALRKLREPLEARLTLRSFLTP